MSQLLVSVRSAVEAEAALLGGAHLIDVKEPSRGPLGRADDDVVAAVLDVVAGHRPVSAAMGELMEEARPPYSGTGLTYIKWGLAWAERARGRLPSWQELLPGSNRAQVVPVAYADWRMVHAPPLAHVLSFAQRVTGVLLVDTFDKKTGRHLLNWMTKEDIFRLCRQCREMGVRVALAGSLRAAQIQALRPAEPDWFAVRAAACEGGHRDAPLSADKVRELVELLSPSRDATREG
jgi:uncharacterized protein (UPF0264 family)